MDVTEKKTGVAIHPADANRPVNYPPPPPLPPPAPACAPHEDGLTTFNPVSGVGITGVHSCPRSAAALADSVSSSALSTASPASLTIWLIAAASPADSPPTSTCTPPCPDDDASNCVPAGNEVSSCPPTGIKPTTPSVTRITNWPVSASNLSQNAVPRTPATPNGVRTS
nr:hypothetical protein [Geminisphaera colitermitum]